MFIAVDVGGTKVDLCLFDGQGSLVDSVQHPTGSLEPGSNRFLERLGAVVNEFSAGRASALGVAMKGLVHGGRVRIASLLGGAATVQPREFLADRCGLPTILDNDLAPQLVAEYYLGAGRGRENFVILNIGTGLAMATFSGVVVRGHQSMAGQLHFHRHWVDSCSAWMPVEQILSGRGLLGRIAAASTRLGIEPHPTVGSLFEIGYRASQELPDELLQIRSDFIQHLARLIAEIGCFYAPEAIILTSGVSRSVPFFLDEVRARYEESRDPMVVAPEVVRSELTHLNCRGMWAIHTFGYPNHVVE